MRCPSRNYDNRADRRLCAECGGPLAALCPLHVYGGDIFAAKLSVWHPRTGEELLYDVPQFFTWCKELAEARNVV